MTKINIKFVITVAAIVFASIVIGLGALAVGKLNRQSDEIDSLSNRIIQLDFDSRTTQSKIDDLKKEIVQLLEEQGRNHYGVDYVISDLNTESRTAIVEVCFSLKESPISGDVEVSFGKGNQFTQIVATKLAAGKYTAEIELQIDKDYEISYSAKLATVRTEKMLEINVSRRLKNRFSSSCGYYSMGRNDWRVDFYLGNSHSNNDKLKIKTAALEIYKDGTLIKTLNIKDYAVKPEENYEQYSSKDIVINELTHDDYADGRVSIRIVVTDNSGLEYIFEK